MASPEEDDFQRHIAIELIVLFFSNGSLGTADAHDLTFLTHLIERALIEARETACTPEIHRGVVEPEGTPAGKMSFFDRQPSVSHRGVLAAPGST